MKNTIKCKLHHDQFGTVDVDGLYAFCKQYNHSPYLIGKLIKGLKDEVNGWVVSGKELNIKPKPQPKSQKDHTYNCGLITPKNIKIAPFKTAYSGSREDATLASWEDHIPLFEDAHPDSLYSRFVALMIRHNLGHYNLSACSFKPFSETYDDLQAFFLKFKRDINESGFVRYKHLFHSGADASNLSVFLKQSPYYTSLILYKLEHDIPEESEE
ncbi:hypothetical protein [Vibrio cholerae]|uniref:hypothetical protein n=1 Tax=Vibrio cholerae TaxID=666 RepID=UPI00084B50AB|nr:hypothetical protein [Vibrio cholerae]OEC29958.1 hypothetical protein BFX13_18305 [Vibrio cholerae]